MDQREDRLKATGSWNGYDLESRLRDLRVLRIMNSNIPFEEKKSIIDRIEKGSDVEVDS